MEATFPTLTCLYIPHPPGVCPEIQLEQED
jgi:hypothetical protein